MKKPIILGVIVLIALFLLSLINPFGARDSVINAQESVKLTEKEKDMSEISLPPAKAIGKMSVEEAIQKRKSVRKYSDKALSPEQVSQILWAAYGTNPRKGFVGRNVPSAGALYPIAVYLVDKTGIYRYQPLNHSLLPVRKGNFQSDLVVAAMGQTYVKQASASLVVTGDVGKCAQRYGERAFRYVAMEAGHIGQNVSLQAVVLGLDTVMLGAFQDEAVAEVLKLSDKETPLYIIPVGYGAE
jgi:SagB-type dehydrogenase family enzyme